jgi:RNA polymerase primary sigma factor
LRACLGSLDDRQRRVLELRYGLDGGKPRTLEEIGLVFNVSRERIRQIERQSLRDLELLPQAQQLRDVARDRPSPLLRAVN